MKSETAVHKIYNVNNTFQVKNLNKHKTALVILAFIVMPVVSILFITSGEQSALFNSLSRLAWVEGRFWEVVTVGLLNLLPFMYSVVLITKVGNFSTMSKKLLISLSSIGCALLFIGLGIPAYIYQEPYYIKMRTAHAWVCAVGFFLPYAVLLILGIMLCFRNKKEGLFSIARKAFMLIACVFAITSVNHPDSYCTTSSPAQIMMFSFYNIEAVIELFLLDLFKPSYAKNIS